MAFSTLAWIATVKWSIDALPQLFNLRATLLPSLRRLSAVLDTADDRRDDGAISIQTQYASTMVAPATAPISATSSPRKRRPVRRAAPGTASELDEGRGLLWQRKEEEGRFHGQLEAMSSGASARIRSCHLGRWRRRVFQRS